MCAIVREPQVVPESRGLGEERLQFGVVPVLQRIGRDDLGQWNPRACPQMLQMGRVRAPQVDGRFAHVGVADDRGEPVANPQRQVSRHARSPREADVRRERLVIGVDVLREIRRDVGALRDVVPIGAGRERGIGRSLEVLLGQSRKSSRIPLSRAAHLLERPQPVARGFLADVRDGDEMRLLISSHGRSAAWSAAERPARGHDANAIAIRRTPLIVIGSVRIV